MEIKKIDTEAEYQEALKRVGELVDQNQDPKSAEEMERLSKMLEEYVDRNIDDFSDEEKSEEGIVYQWEKDLEDII